MKHRILAVILAFCCALSSAFAQDIDALLATMPADTIPEFNAACAEMVAAGPDAIQQIAERLVPVGKGDDNAARFAISGMAKYVTRPGAEQERALFASAIGQTLQSDASAEVKQFLMHQLEIAGGPEVVPMLKSFLDHPELAGPATRALESIGETTLAASQPSPAVAPAGHPELDQALQLLDAGKKRNALSALIEAGTSEDAALRAAALGLAARVEGRVATKKWVRAMEDSAPETKIDILNMLAERGDTAALSGIEDELRSDHHGVRMAAIAALNAIGTDDAVRALQEHRRKTKDTNEMAAVKDALRRLVPAQVWMPAADAEGFVPLLNGEDLEGWTGHVGGYEMKDGVLSSKTSALNLYSEDAYGNFVLRFEFKLTENANNGVGIRVPLFGHAAYDGMEIQVLDDTGSKYTELKPYQYHGSVYGIVAAERGHLKPVGEWNSQEITADGSHVKVVLNGQTIVDADVVEAAQPAPLDGKEHPGLTRERGHICLAGHSTVVHFRNLRIKPLP